MQKRPLPDISRYVPPGKSWQDEALAWLLVLGPLLVLLFIDFNNQLQQALYLVLDHSYPQPQPLAGAVMEDFGWIARRLPLLVGLNLLYLAACAVNHYAYHYRGSKSIYLMRRLPQRWELHRRCLALPLLGLLLTLLLLLAVTLICYAVYVNKTPAACLPPDQWARLWRIWLGGSL